ncbi:MAG TPA: hypothetical protein VG944_22750 [Fimbriimonas sp.]|nr:hypothetical protein [Fimbriimonas sp.]
MAVSHEALENKAEGLAEPSGPALRFATWLSEDEAYSDREKWVARRYAHSAAVRRGLPVGLATFAVVCLASFFVFPWVRIAFLVCLVGLLLERPLKRTPLWKLSLKMSEKLAGPKHVPVSDALEPAKPDPTQQWTVRLDVVRGECVMGSDTGLIWFDDDRLYFCGRYTSFAIPGWCFPEGLQRPAEIVRPVRRRFLLPIEAPVRGAKLRIQFDLVQEDVEGPHHLQICSAVENCTAKASADAEGQLPPLDFGPSVPRLFELRRLLVMEVFKFGSLGVVGSVLLWIGLSNFGFDWYFFGLAATVWLTQVYLWGRGGAGLLLRAIQDENQLRSLVSISP